MPYQILTELRELQIMREFDSDSPPLPILSAGFIS